MARTSLINPLGLTGGAQTVAMLIFGVGGYILYYKHLPPFTADNIARVKKFLSPKDDDTPDITEGLPPGAIPLPGQPAFEQPNAPLTTSSILDPQPKPDESIRQDFIREIYKQIYLPYDKYPFLYSQGATGYINSNNLSGALGPSNDPGGLAFNYRPPIRGGDIPPGAPDADQWFDNFYQAWGYYPPGGGYSYPYYDAPPFDPLSNLVRTYAARQFPHGRKGKDFGHVVRQPKKIPPIGVLQRRRQPIVA